MICLENALKITLQDVLKMSWRPLEEVLKTFWRCLEDVLKTSWRHLGKTSWRRLGKTSWRCLGKTSWRRLENVLKTYGQDEYIGLDQDVLNWRRLEDVFWRRKANANIIVLIKTSSSRRMFAGMKLETMRLVPFFHAWTVLLLSSNDTSLLFSVSFGGKGLDILKIFWDVSCNCLTFSISFSFEWWQSQNQHHCFIHCCCYYCYRSFSCYASALFSLSIYLKVSKLLLLLFHMLAC